jgi:hypothetical protein
VARFLLGSVKSRSLIVENLASLNRLSGHAAIDGPGRAVTGQSAAKGEHCTLADRYTRTDTRHSSNPSSSFNIYRAHEQIEANGAPVVVSGTEVSALGKTYVIGKSDFPKVIYPDFFSNPTVVSYGQSPRKLYSAAGLYDYPFPDSCAKCP